MSFTSENGDIIACLKSAYGTNYKPLPTGFNRLDDALGGGLYPGQYLLTGMPGGYKTTFALNVAMNASHDCDDEHDDFSDAVIAALEQNPADYVSRLIARASMSPDLDGEPLMYGQVPELLKTDEGVNRLHAIGSELDKHSCIDVQGAPGTSSTTPADWVAYQLAYTEYGCTPSLMVIDSLHRLSTPRELPPECDGRVITWDLSDQWEYEKVDTSRFEIPCTKEEWETLPADKRMYSDSASIEGPYYRVIVGRHSEFVTPQLLPGATPNDPHTVARYLQDLACNPKRITGDSVSQPFPIITIVRPTKNAIDSGGVGLTGVKGDIDIVNECEGVISLSPTGRHRADGCEIVEVYLPKNRHGRVYEREPVCKLACHGGLCFCEETD